MIQVDLIQVDVGRLLAKWFTQVAMSWKLLVLTFNNKVINNLLIAKPQNEVCIY